jgi:hypothetical protein
LLAGALPAVSRELARQQHVVEDGKIRQQVELLEDETDVIHPEAIPPRCREAVQGLAQDFHGAGLRHDDAADGRQQRALAAAAGAADENMFTSSDLEMRQGQCRVRLAGPGEAQLAHGNGGGRGGRSGRVMTT